MLESLLERLRTISAETAGSFLAGIIIPISVYLLSSLITLILEKAPLKRIRKLEIRSKKDGKHMKIELEGEISQEEARQIAKRVAQFGSENA